MHELLNAFCFFDPAALSGAAADADRYASIVGWAGRARGTNPNAFDAMTDLLLDDAAWTPEALPASASCFFGPAGPFPWADRASARMSARAGAVGACQRGGVSGAGQAGGPR